MRLDARLAAAAACLAAAPASGQQTMDWPVEDVQPYPLDSGLRENPGPTAETVDAHLVHVEDAAWLRVYFGTTTLGAGSFVRLTSMLDGEVQELDRQGLSDWSHGSAYFNGESVLVELVAGPGTDDNRLVVTDVALELTPGGVAGGCGVCGDDDRVPSAQHWVGRLLPGGCTTSLWNSDSCLVSAGHCIDADMVVEFQVPSSDPDCGINHPPVADQFPVIDVIYVSGGVGNDWATLVPGVNSQGETPYERFGEFRSIASVASPGNTLSVVGFGVDTECVNSQVQQTSDGTMMTIQDLFFTHDVDTTFGNSGSSITHDGEIVGIATHCNCPNNSATRIDHPEFQEARDSLCPPLLFDLPDGLPDVLDPSGGTTVTVTIDPQWATPVPGSGEMTIELSGKSETIDMVEIRPNVYEATFPPGECGTVAWFSFEVQTFDGFRVGLPSDAPIHRFSAIVAEEVTPLFADDFETDESWTVESNGGLANGAWERGIPVDCELGDPAADGDGSGQCYVTGNSSASKCDTDVDGGTTTLISPVVDVSGGAAIVEYHRWFHNNVGQAPFTEVMTIDVSGDGGVTWSSLETVGPIGPEVSGTWFHQRLVLADAGIDPTDELQVRFVAADPDPASLVEAAIDGFRVVHVSCDGPSCPADLDGDGEVGVLDLVEMVTQWGTCPKGACPADLDGDGQVAVGDLVALIVAWGSCE